MLAFIVVCVAWNRRKLAEKNRGLYRQIKDQDRLAEENNRLANDMMRIRTELEELKRRCEPNAAVEEKTEIDEQTQQRALVAQLNEYLLTDRNFAEPEKTNIENLIKTIATNRTYLFQAVKTVYGTGV